MAEENKVVESKTNESYIYAALSYLWILSIVFYVLKKEDEFVVFHARQAMVLFGLAVLGWATWWLLGLGFIIEIIALVLMIIGGLKAYKGEKYRLPLVSDIAEKINF